MALVDRNFREIFSSQMVSIIGGLIAGTLLAVYTDHILLIPGMIILIPGFLEMRGSISGSLAARVTAGLFLHLIRPNQKSRIIRSNILSSFFLALLVSLVLGVIAYLFNLFILGIYYPAIIIIPVIAGLIADAAEVPLTLFFTFYFFKKGHDPNNIMGPFVTSTGDITSIVALLIALALL